jgi:hypothetical protein
MGYLEGLFGPPHDRQSSLWRVASAGSDLLGRSRASSMFAVGQRGRNMATWGHHVSVVFRVSPGFLMTGKRRSDPRARALLRRVSCTTPALARGPSSCEEGSPRGVRAQRGRLPSCYRRGRSASDGGGSSGRVVPAEGEHIPKSNSRNAYT